MCLPKKDGGLGLRSTRHANYAIIQKGLWEFYNNLNSLWGSLIRSKYKCGRYGLPKVEPNKHGSNFCKGLGHEWTNFRDNLDWNFRNREDIRFWKDKCVSLSTPIALGT